VAVSKQRAERCKNEDGEPNTGESRDLAAAMTGKITGTHCASFDLKMARLEAKEKTTNGGRKI